MNIWLIVMNVYNIYSKLLKSKVIYSISLNSLMYTKACGLGIIIYYINQRAVGLGESYEDTDSKGHWQQKEQQHH